MRVVTVCPAADRAQREVIPRRLVVVVVKVLDTLGSQLPELQNPKNLVHLGLFKDPWLECFKNGDANRVEVDPALIDELDQEV